MKTIILKIGGMSCSACSNGLEKYLNKQEHIKKATVNLVLQTAQITYDDCINKNDIEKYILEAGFESLGENILEDKKISYKPLIIYGILGLVLMYISMAPMLKLPTLFNLNKLYAIILLIMTIPFLFYGKDILKSGYKNLIHKMPNMDTLVMIGVLSSFIYSLYSVIMILNNNNNYLHMLYFESTAFVIYFIKLGRFIEDKNKDKTKDAIKDLVKITPSFARLKTKDGYKEVTIDEVNINDILICLPGDKIAVDGIITTGKSHFDEAFITGESTPTLKTINDEVLAGSINYDGKIEYKALKIGKNSTISEIVHLVVEATNTKPPISKLADKVSSIFVPIVISLALLTFIINLIIGVDLYNSINKFITILVVACPCSLGLATPLAMTISIGNIAKKGILIKNNTVLELASKIKTIVFDKTGTLTYGNLTISKLYNYTKLKDKDILKIIGSIEKNSIHPIAISINNYIKNNNIKIDEFATEDILGYGIKATYKKDIYYAGNESLLQKLNIKNTKIKDSKKLLNEGNTIIYLIKNNEIIALFGLKDIVRKESKELINYLNKENKNVYMLSGDNNITANKIGEELNIKNIIANVKPKEKTNYIKNLLKDDLVMMVGDGINDAPSLTTASIGVSLKGATDIAASSSNVILMNDNLLGIIDLFKISKKTINNIKLNLFWAFFYNIIMIPIAMGLFNNIKINPMLACLAMILSSITVTLNALRLRK